MTEFLELCVVLIRFTSFTLAGGPFGTVISLPVSSYLCEYLGWQSVFYVFGSLGCVWFLVWTCLIYDGPELHPRISDKEKIFLKVKIFNNIKIQHLSPRPLWERRSLRNPGLSPGGGSSPVHQSGP